MRAFGDHRLPHTGLSASPAGQGDWAHGGRWCRSQLAGGLADGPPRLSAAAPTPGHARFRQQAAHPSSQLYRGQGEQAKRGDGWCTHRWLAGGRLTVRQLVNRSAYPRPCAPSACKLSDTRLSPKRVTPWDLPRDQVTPAGREVVTQRPVHALLPRRSRRTAASVAWAGHHPPRTIFVPNERTDFPRRPETLIPSSLGSPPSREDAGWWSRKDDPPR